MRRAKCAKYGPSRRTKRILAWLFMFACYAVFAWLTLVYGLTFGNDKFRNMVISWSIALGQTFAVDEPLLILLAQLIPSLIETLSSSEVFNNLFNACMATGLAKGIGVCLDACKC